jgi:hypothetical protein
VLLLLMLLCLMVLLLFMMEMQRVLFVIKRNHFPQAKSYRRLSENPADKHDQQSKAKQTNCYYSCCRWLLLPHRQ